MTETAQKSAGCDDNSDKKINGSDNAEVVNTNFDNSGVRTFFDKNTHYLGWEKLAYCDEENTDTKHHKIGCLEAFAYALEFTCTIALGNIA